MKVSGDYRFNAYLFGDGQMERDGGKGGGRGGGETGVYKNLMKIVVIRQQTHVFIL